MTCFHRIRPVTEHGLKHQHERHHDGQFSPAAANQNPLRTTQKGAAPKLGIELTVLHRGFELKQERRVLLVVLGPRDIFACKSLDRLE